MKKLIKESNIIYLKSEYKNESVLPQKKSLKLFKLAIFSIVTSLSFYNLFSTNPSYIVLGSYMTFLLFIYESKWDIAIKSSKNCNKVSNTFRRVAK